MMKRPSGLPVGMARSIGIPEHDNDDHREQYIPDGDGVERETWVIEAGAADPAEAAPEDLIFEKEN